MSTSIIWVQVIIAIIPFLLVSQWLKKVTKNSLVTAAILTLLTVIWVDNGGFAGITKLGITKFTGNILLDAISYTTLFIIIYFYSKGGD